MGLAFDTTVVVLLVKVMGLIGCVLLGLALLRSAHIDRTPRLAQRREARRKPYVSPFAASLPAKPLPPRLAEGVALSRLVRVLDAAGERLDSVHAASTSAAREINGAEIALNRLLADIAGVMPIVIAPTIVPRRLMPTLVAEPRAVAA